MDSAYFSGRSGGEKNCIPKIFLKNLDPLCGPVAGKPLVLEVLSGGGHFCGICRNC